MGSRYNIATVKTGTIDMKAKDLILSLIVAVLSLGLVVATNHTQARNNSGELTPHTGSAGIGIDYQPGQQPW